MRDGGRRTLLTLEERLERAAKSCAASPEAASGMVRRLFGIHTAYLFCGRANSNIMEELTGEFWEGLGEELLHYGGFCRCFEMAISCDNKVFGCFPQGPSVEEAFDSYRPVWGVRVNNAVVLLGLLLLDHAKGGMFRKDIYHCTRMTLGQYLDALGDVGVQGEGASDLYWAKDFQVWKDGFLKDYDSASPMGEILADILRRYMAAWQEFDHLDHILRCMGALACYLEENGAAGTPMQPEKSGEADVPMRPEEGGEVDVSVQPEEGGEADAPVRPEEGGKADVPVQSEEGGKEDVPWRPEASDVRHFREALCQYSSDLEGWDLVEIDKRYLDPCGYYFALAYEYPEEIPDPGSKDTAPGTIRSQIFLSERDYSPETLRALAAKSPSPELGELLEKSISEERLAEAMREINMAVTDLYMLWVEPYRHMEKKLPRV